MKLLILLTFLLFSINTLARVNEQQAALKALDASTKYNQVQIAKKNSEENIKRSNAKYALYAVPLITGRLKISEKVTITIKDNKQGILITLPLGN